MKIILAIFTKKIYGLQVILIHYYYHISSINIVRDLFIIFRGCEI